MSCSVADTPTSLVIRAVSKSSKSSSSMLIFAEKIWPTVLPSFERVRERLSIQDFFGWVVSPVFDDSFELLVSFETLVDFRKLNIVVF
jgi:hypothetical protein